MMTSYAGAAIQSVIGSEQGFCKFLSANDTGKTGGHQAGIYISKPSVSILFNELGKKGENKDKWVKIKWQNDFETETRFIYYGKGTRNEYRITNFGKDFPFLSSDYTGAIFVFSKYSEHDYEAFILNTDDEIEEFLDAFGIGPTETNNLIDTGKVQLQTKEKLAVQEFIESLSVEFPASDQMSSAARAIQNNVYNHVDYIISNPDRKIIEWTNMEYTLFRALEYSRYGDMITKGFESVDEFVKIANMVLNRRKSRAGKSLEHHLSAIFDGNTIQYTAQAVTEGNKKPDFIFPSKEAYHNKKYSVENLITLAAKTTCKDRWRQMLNEADRLRGKPKYLCTLQQGISSAQMDEMQDENVILVVPKPYIAKYPEEKQERIWTLGRFVSYVREIEGIS